MSLDASIERQATELLLEEADCLDERRWRDWLALYAEDAVYWVPAWDGDDVLIDDPRSEISLIYCNGRARLADRVWRIESGLSSSLIRLPRTRHFVTNIRVKGETATGLVVTANFQANTYKHEEKRTDIFFGQYRYTLARKQDALRIQQKYVVVCNDVIPRQMDIFNI